jgi:hypothetical protein
MPILRHVIFQSGQDYRGVSGGDGPESNSQAVPYQASGVDDEYFDSNGEPYFNDWDDQRSNEGMDSMAEVAQGAIPAPLGEQNTANTSPQGDLGALMPEEGELADIVNESPFSPISESEQI